MPVLYRADQPFPERHRLGVGIVDPEDLDALLDPEQHDAQELLPQRLPMQAVEIDVDDVLVLLRRVFGISDRAVGPELKPLRGLLNPRMIRRALNAETQVDLHRSERRRVGNEVVSTWRSGWSTNQ